MRRDLDYYKKKLLQEKQKVLGQIDSFNDKGYEGLGHSLRESTGELSNYDNHPADGASDIFERSKDIGMRDNSKMILQMIDDALDKIETGQYGYCDNCGQEIDQERLEVMPYSTYCFDCKSKSELNKPQRSRPLEEELINDLHSSDYMNTDDTQNISHDGEDTWQDVARFGTSNTPSDIPGASDVESSYIDADEDQGKVGWEDGIIDE